ncbi:MAG: hypothetical protein ACO39C_02225 [Chthoniobacterales bacterium]
MRLATVTNWKPRPRSWSSVAGMAATVDGWMSWQSNTAPGAAPLTNSRVTREALRYFQSRGSTDHMMVS